jgi:hypothetical protein
MKMYLIDDWWWLGYEQPGGMLHLCYRVGKAGDCIRWG